MGQKQGRRVTKVVKGQFHVGHSKNLGFYSKSGGGGGKPAENSE